MGIIWDQEVEVKWNGNTKKRYIDLGYKFGKYGDTFAISIKHLSPSSRCKVKFTCDSCHCIFLRDYKNGSRALNTYCSKECSGRGKSAKPKERFELTCEQCQNSYYVPNNLRNSSRFCNKKCLQEWQSIAFKGEGSANYVKRIPCKCGTCGINLLRTKNYLDQRSNVFCSKKCSDHYLHNVFMKLPEPIERNRRVALNNLTSGKISQTNSKPQVIVNQILDDLKLDYENEHIEGYFAFDNYLIKHGLYIEVMGTYFHCDHRKYKEVNYEMQVRRIVQDKKKRRKIRNKYKKDILYLWEEDIISQPKLIKSLISLYVESSAKLESYHSFDYFTHKSDLYINEVLEKPYMDFTSKELDLIIDLEIKDKVRGIDPSKYITINCEGCNKEFDRRIKQFIRAKKNYCSKDCRTNSTRRLLNCYNCKAEITVKKYIADELDEGKRNSVFCDRHCKYKWDSKFVGKLNPQYERFEKECEFCKKKVMLPKNRLDRFKFCSKKCTTDSRAKPLNKVSCEQCGKDVYKNDSKLKKSKNHFCSNSCADTFRSNKAYTNDPCESCHKEFRRRKKLKQRFCSTACQASWQSIALRGENANNFKHGKAVSKIT
ncbi:hypothetical protein ACI2JA_04155 [Alkalihalobacillus sp. NPDC078783]